MVRGFFGTGVAQVLFGIISLGLGVVALSHPLIHGIPGYLVLSSHFNIWGSMLLCITGGIGISTRNNPSSSLIKSYYRLSWACMLLCLCMLFVNVFGLVTAHSSFSPISRLMIIIQWILTPLVSLQFILFVVSVSYKCCSDTTEDTSTQKRGKRWFKEKMTTWCNDSYRLQHKTYCISSKLSLFEKQIRDSYSPSLDLV